MLFAALAAPAAAQSAPAGSGTVLPPVLVAGDSMAHEAADELARSLAALGYHDVRFAVYGGTTMSWATDRVIENAAPIVVFGTGTYESLLGWTATTEQETRRAVDVLDDRRCAVWALPAAARYPGGQPQPDQASEDLVAGIRRAVAGGPVHLAEWDLVADALPELYTDDGVHLGGEGQELYASLVANAVRHRCEDADPARTAPWQRYATWATGTLLGRAPTGEELVTWTDRLTAGHPSLAYTRLLTASPEWAGGRIDDLYRRAFGREADPAGRAYWRGLVVAGMPLDAVAAHLFGSEEFLTRSGGTTHGLITGLYRQILHREPDPTGMVFWEQHLAGGTARHTVAGAFYASAESRGDRVDGLYRSILGRAPDPGGRSFWVDALPHMTDLRLAALLAASPEAFERAQQAG